MTLLTCTVVRGDNTAFPKRLASKHLPNPVQLHPHVISGGLPEGDQAFHELAERGIRTIISVDGAKPDVALAHKYGMRYVHLPHGYDGISPTRTTELAKAVRDLAGPIYVHCHHGKHRSPAAAAVACVAAGLIPPSEAIAVLELAGTNKNYRGLYQSAKSARPFAATSLDQLHVDFHEMVAVPPMAEAMVQLGHTHDHIKQIAQAGWKTPPNHPDLEPVHETLLLREHFTELLRTPGVQSQPAAFERMLRESEADARALQTALATWQSAPDAAKLPDSISKISKRISENCNACHVRYRDVPLSEKTRP